MVLLWTNPMNIFAVQPNPLDAAHDLCDKHVVKMIVESAQMLSTAHRVLDGNATIRISKSNRKLKHWVHPCTVRDAKLCLPAMVNHPCTIWVMQGSDNYMWLWQHTTGLLKEYTDRYSKQHSMRGLVNDYLSTLPVNIRRGQLSPFAQAMPEHYKTDDAVTAYRNYYIGDKKRFAKWSKTSPPSWFVNTT
jgi:hypothetical protein